MGTAAKAFQHKRAASTVFDLELDDVAGSRSSVADVATLQELTAASSPAQLQLLKDAEQAREISANNEDVDLRAFAEVLALRGYQVCLRTGKPDNCCAGVASLKHTFVVASVPADAMALESTSLQLFVVDPSFRDSFLLSNATSNYRRLFDALPSIYVGTAEQLLPLVEFMCSQMQLVFAETDISCPPWRQQACMISKWLPASADDTPIFPSDGSSSNPSAAIEESPFADPVSTSRLTCQITRSTSNGSASTCSQLVFTPRAKPPYYSDNTSSNILLSGSLAGAGDAVLDVFASGGSFGCHVDSSCVVYTARSPGSWQAGKAGYCGLGGASWHGSGAPIEAFYSYRDEAEQLDCEGAVAIRSDNSINSINSIKDGPRGEVLRSTSNLTAALAAAGPLSRGVSSVSARCSLDIARFNTDVQDVDVHVDLLSPRLAKQQQQQQPGVGAGVRPLNSPRTPVKNQKTGLLSSALSAAAAGKGFGRV